MDGCRSAAEMAKREVDGFVLSGLGCGESAEERERMLRTSLSALQGDKPRMVTGLGTPAEVRCMVLRLLLLCLW